MNELVTRTTSDLRTVDASEARVTLADTIDTSTLLRTLVGTLSGAVGTRETRLTLAESGLGITLTVTRAVTRTSGLSTVSTRPTSMAGTRTVGVTSTMDGRGTVATALHDETTVRTSVAGEALALAEVITFTVTGATVCTALALGTVGTSPARTTLTHTLYLSGGLTSVVVNVDEGHVRIIELYQGRLLAGESVSSLWCVDGGDDATESVCAESILANRTLQEDGVVRHRGEDDALTVASTRVGTEDLL